MAAIWQATSLMCRAVRLVVSDKSLLVTKLLHSVLRFMAESPSQSHTAHSSVTSLTDDELNDTSLVELPSKASAFRLSWCRRNITCCVRRADVVDSAIYEHGAAFT